jgi:hypothetical protein
MTVTALPSVPAAENPESNFRALVAAAFQAAHGPGHDPGEVVRLCRMGVAAFPGSPWACFALARALVSAGTFAAGVRMIVRGRRLGPDEAISRTIYNTLFQHCRDLLTRRRTAEAWQVGELLVLLDPGNWKTSYLMAGAVLENRDFDGAIHHYTRAIQQVRLDGERREDPAVTAQLVDEIGQFLWFACRTLGRYEDMARVQRTDVPLTGVHTPVWDSRPAPGRTLLVFFGMGLGDTFQHLRYAKIVTRDFHMRMVAAVPARLVDAVRTCPYLDDAVDIAGPFPPHDLVAVDSRHFNSLDESAGPSTVPYLAPRATVVERWRPLVRSPEVFTIAINSRSGRPGDDDMRSMPAWFAARLCEIQGVRVLDITQDAPPHPGPGLTVLGDRIDRDPRAAFTDSAAIMALADLVISSDTSVAHLAGAMGLPLWIGLIYRAESRWGPAGDTTPLYPQARLFRQACPESWDNVLYEMKMGLVPLVAKKLFGT